MQKLCQCLILYVRRVFMWNYKSQAGNFWIVSRDRDEYLLGIGDEVLGQYKSAEEAVSDVDEQNTGYPKWDNIRKSNKTGGINNWKEEQ